MVKYFAILQPMSLAIYLAGLIGTKGYSVFKWSVLFNANFFINSIIFTGITVLKQYFSCVQSEYQKPENKFSFRYVVFRTLNIT